MEIEPGDRVLDIGCGFGTNGIFAAQSAGPEGFVAFVDSNVRAIALAEQNARGQRRAGVRDVRHSTVEGPKQGTFDVALANPPYFAAGSDRAAVHRTRPRRCSRRDGRLLPGHEAAGRGRRDDGRGVRLRRGGDAPGLYRADRVKRIGLSPSPLGGEGDGGRRLTCRPGCTTIPSHRGR